MAWRVKMPDGSLSQPFDTAAEANTYAEGIDEYTGRTPEEIYDSAVGPRVPRGAFLRRMAMGWTPHRALHTTLDGRYLGLARPQPGPKGTDEMTGVAGELHEMLGRKRTIAQWSESSGVSESRIRKGITRYGTLQNFFLNIGWYPFKPAQPEPEDID